MLAQPVPAFSCKNLPDTPTLRNQFTKPSSCPTSPAYDDAFRKSDARTKRGAFRVGCYNSRDMQKDFDAWNKIKKQTNIEPPRLYTVREIWWCRLGVNVGTEQDGKGGWYARPCLIMRAFGPSACLVAPLTTSTREHPLRVPAGIVNGQDARANLSQLRVIDTRRLERKIGFLDKRLFTNIRKTARAML